MNRPRLSKFPLHKPFERQTPTTPFSQIALRLIVNFYSDAPYIVGTATVLCGNLLVTAKHVFRDILEPGNQSLKEQQDGVTIALEKHVVALQLIPGPQPEYIVWDIHTATLDPASDLALLRLATNPGRSHPDNPHEWKQPFVMPFAPDIGETIAAFGFRRSSIQVSKNAAGGNHIDLNDEPMTSVGIVREVYEWKRDDAFLPFPCYHVGARFDAGMSGGPVFEETGALCGIVCANLDGSHLLGEPVSYVSTLWPLFRLVLSADRGNKFPRGIEYPAVDLARGGQIKVTDLPRLERWFAEHIKS